MTAEITYEIGCVSLYANPLHKGHIDMINEAKKRCKFLYAIVNNDKQRELKGSQEFMDEDERVLIVKNLKGVDLAIISVDTDSSVCKSLEILHPDAFFNGGDRSNDEVPEKEVCDRLGIVMVDNIGGKKVQSSSSLLENIREVLRRFG
jgi:cytidyltransferase-like protein